LLNQILVVSRAGENFSREYFLDKISFALRIRTKNSVEYNIVKVSDNNLPQDNDLKKQVINSIAWLGGLKYLGQLICWGITIVVIRILNPEDYGLMAMASVCTNFLLMISELGLGAAIIQKKELDEDKLSRVFGFIILSHGLLFLILFFGSHLIARYFSEPRLVLILQVSSLNLVSLSLYVIPRAVLMRRMDFKRKSIVDLIATVVSACFILMLVLLGKGVWSLILGSMLLHIINLIGYNLLAPNFLLPKFDFKKIKEFISFGSYILGSRILWYFYSKSDILIGGRILGNQLLGIYSVALELSSIPLDKFMPVINQVAFPAYARIQSDLELVRTHFLKATRIGSLLIFPTFWGLLIVAPELLGWLLGSKWSDVILPVQILCVTMPFRALASLIFPVLYGIGRVDIHFRYVAIASILMPLCFLIAAHYWGIIGICLVWVFGYVVVFFIHLKLSLRLINLSIPKFLSNILIAPFASAVMMLVIFGIKCLIPPLLPLPIMTCFFVIIGVSTYSFLVYLLKREAFYEIWSLVPLKKK